MAPDGQNKERKVATPKSKTKKAGRTTDTAKAAEKPSPPGLIHLAQDETPVITSARKSRKRAAELFDGPEDEPVQLSEDKNSEKPQKKAKTAAKGVVKPSKADGHPVETAKSAPGGDMMEIEPAEQPKAKKGNAQARKKDEKSQKANNAKVDQPSEPPSSKKPKRAEKTAKAKAGKSEEQPTETTEAEKDVQPEALSAKKSKAAEKKAKAAAEKESKTDKADDQPTPTSKKGKGQAKTEAAKQDVVAHTKPSKADGHPVEVDKTAPGGDSIEVEPANIPKPKKTKADKTKKVDEPTKKDKDATPKGQKAAKDKSGTAKNTKKPTEDAVTNGGPSGDSKAAGKKSKKGGPEPSADAGPNPLTESPVETALKSLTPEKDAQPSQPVKKKPGRPPGSGKAKDDKEVVAEAAASAKTKKGKETAKKNTTNGDSVSKKPASQATPAKTDQKKKTQTSKKAEEAADTGLPSEKVAENTQPKPEKSKKRKGAPEPDAEQPKAGHVEETSKTEAEKAKKRKTATTHDVDAVKDDLLEPLSEIAAARKEQKKPKGSSSDTASSTIGNLISSGLEAVSHGADAAKEILAGIASGTSKSLMGDVSEAALGAATKKKVDKETSKPSKKGKAKAKEADTTPATELSKPTESDTGGETTLVAPEADSDSDSDYDDQTAALLKGFESDGDEGDVDTSKGFTQGQEIPQLPDKNKKLSKQLKKVKGDSDEPGVVYIGRIPHGFHEHEMRAYFTQFGTVNHVRLSRSKKTGNSKHFAFLEFASAEVAKIVADTMDNYIMFGHLLKCKLVPKDEVHPEMWKGADKRFKKVPWNKIEGRKLELAKGREEWAKKNETEKKRRSKKAKEMKELGYEFEGGELKDVAEVPVRERKAVEGAEETAMIEGGSVEVVEQEKSIVVAGDEEGGVVVSEEIVTKVVAVEKEGEGVPGEKDAGKVAKGGKKEKKTRKSKGAA